MSATALIELRDALYAVTHTDAVLRDHISGRGVYLLKAPPGSSPGYLVIGPVLIDAPDPYYGQGGRRHRRRLTGWARTASSAEEMYARCVALLDGTLLSLDGGHTMQRSNLAWLGGPVEEESPATGTTRPTSLWGVHMDWSVKTVET